MSKDESLFKSQTGLLFQVNTPDIFILCARPNMTLSLTFLTNASFYSIKPFRERFKASASLKGISTPDLSLPSLSPHTFLPLTTLLRQLLRCRTRTNKPDGSLKLGLSGLMQLKECLTT